MAQVVTDLIPSTASVVVFVPASQDVFAFSLVSLIFASALTGPVKTTFGVTSVSYTVDVQVQVYSFLQDVIPKDVATRASSNTFFIF